eukprot:4159337-Amphidinium_carterae.1
MTSSWDVILNARAFSESEADDDKHEVLLTTYTTHSGMGLLQAKEANSPRCKLTREEFENTTAQTRHST